MPKYIMGFSKLGLMKYTSHLDMVRLFKRSFKKANINLVHSQGFNPHPKMAFVLPLSLGYESTCELLEFEIVGTELSEEEMGAKLKGIMPEGISVDSLIENKESGNLSGRVVEAEYVIKFHMNLDNVNLDNVDLEDLGLDNLAEKFLGQEQILVQKRAKSKHRRKGFDFKEVDIKPLIVNLDARLISDVVALTARLKAGSTENLNPELLLKSIIDFANLDIKKEDAQIMRTEIILG